ncbi:peroxisomal membrane protein PEX16 [Ixodes scapularis]|nr:peroxisomal membrane protein PEX16 [Ixodes scapularis]
MADLLVRYRELVKANPSLASELETVLRWISYFSAGRFGKSAVVAELLYSASSLLTLANDLILRHAANVPVHLDRAVEKLQSCLAVVEYLEVFMELAALHLRGDTARWVAVGLVQIIKAGLRLVLLLRHGQGLQCSPAVAPLDRRRQLQPAQGTSGGPSTPAAEPSYSLRHSGRIVRTLAGAPPASRRQWKPPGAQTEVLERTSPTPLQGPELAAELAHVLRPVAHLSALGIFGRASWGPWALAAALDLASLQVLARARPSLQPRERVELSRRFLHLVLYLVRSPFYKRVTERPLLSLLRGAGESVPFLGLVTRPLAEYLPEWQDTYCHNWSS